MPKRPMKNNYTHTEIPELSGAFLDEGMVRAGTDRDESAARPLETALAAMNLARRLGIPSPWSCGTDELPYGRGAGASLFEAPLLSAAAGKRIVYLRGWSEFDSCIKGFNSLGLMAERVLEEYERIRALPLAARNALKLEYLRSRTGPEGRVFCEKDLQGIAETEYLPLDDRDIAVWRCFASRTIVCSTSSNMGISTHQALRLMQRARLEFRGRSFSLLNASEGRLVIWCPDERADFMNEEKTRFLRGLEKDLPRITSLKTYINRQQRDPGALKDALLGGGYFFPTNPQSKEEMQNLIFVALNEIAKERDCRMEEVLKDANVLWALESMGCEVRKDRVIVRAGIEGGIHGLMVPYIILLEHCLKCGLGRSVSAWNQASIGAALAGAALADKYLRRPDEWRDDLRGELNGFFPALSGFLDTRKIGRDFETRIHGVFDIANLQSLAQLLGVVVEHHQSGRSAAYVGLGSSSYSNGNRCAEILKDELDHGAFRGTKAMHPATHTVNPFAQALIFGEDLYRFLRCRANGTLGPGTVLEGMAHVKKPEPAGAAALAGYLLARLDMRTLSIVEIAYGLKLMGFTQELFLEFTGHGAGGSRAFLQSAFEEGALMERFAQNMLILLDWGLPELERSRNIEMKQSLLRYRQTPLDDAAFERLDGPTCIYLTGDNTRQPSPELVRSLAENCLKNLPMIEEFLAELAEDPSDTPSHALSRVSKATYGCE